MKHAVDATGRVLRDNVWGPQEEDATRRDFTINAMYYDPETQIVVDYHGGIKDAKKLTLRMIGDPATRYREDPVRIIRAVRFAAKLSRAGLQARAQDRGAAASSPARCWPTCRKAACSTRCSSCCRPAIRWPPSSSSRRWAWRAGIYPLLDLVVERAEQPFVQRRAAGHRPPRRRGQAGGAELPAGLRAVGRRARRLGRSASARKQHPFPALQDAIDDVFNVAHRRRVRAAASWAPTCARSG